MTKNQKKVKPSLPKKLIFNFILLCFPIIILLFIEVLLRINHFVHCPYSEFKEYKINNSEIGKKYFQKFENNIPCIDMFLKKKPANGFRIFVLGSSNVVGFPYDHNLMFSRILEHRLQDIYPDKHIEVLNTAITTVNSFTLLDYIDEIL
jgi:hypothetical protein